MLTLTSVGRSKLGLVRGEGVRGARGVGRRSSLRIPSGFLWKPQLTRIYIKRSHPLWME